jgi:hypothetical protein
LDNQDETMMHVPPELGDEFMDWFRERTEAEWAH